MDAPACCGAPYFGSDMLSTYAHLVESDANNAILREHQLATTSRSDDTFRVRSCPACRELNPVHNTRCAMCHTRLEDALPVGGG